MATVHELSLPGAQIEQIVREENSLRIVFSDFRILISLTGSNERTEWTQRGELIIGNAEVENELPTPPLTLAGGDIHQNAYVYRNEIPLPLKSRGQVGCVLQFEGIDERLEVHGESIELIETAERKYIRHVRDN